MSGPSLFNRPNYLSLSSFACLYHKLKYFVPFAFEVVYSCTYTFLPPYPWYVLDAFNICCTNRWLCTHTRSKPRLVYRPASLAEPGTKDAHTLAGKSSLEDSEGKKNCKHPTRHPFAADCATTSALALVACCVTFL